jgi:GT2 family glycosyltransferase
MDMASIVIVNWNSGRRLENCVRSLLNHAAGCPIIVVDNASTDGSMDFDVQSETASIIRNNRNIGFAAACNAGWKAGTDEKVLFLNPDIEAFPNSIQALQEAFATDESVWAVGGRLINSSGDSDDYLRPFPSLWTVASDMLFIDEFTGTKRRRASSFNNSSTPLKIDQPAAACLMVSREALEKTGGFDESFYPAWFEDVDLCRRIWNSGGQILYQPAARFLHQGGYSARRLSHQAFLEYFYGNQILYFYKHHGRRAASAAHKLIACGLLLRSALSLVFPLARNESRLNSAKSFWNAQKSLLRSERIHL